MNMVPIQKEPRTIIKSPSFLWPPSYPETVIPFSPLSLRLYVFRSTFGFLFVCLFSNSSSILLYTLFCVFSVPTESWTSLYQYIHCCLLLQGPHHVALHGWTTNDLMDLSCLSLSLVKDRAAITTDDDWIAHNVIIILWVPFPYNRMYTGHI